MYPILLTAFAMSDAATIAGSYSTTAILSFKETFALLIPFFFVSTSSMPTAHAQQRIPAISKITFSIMHLVFYLIVNQLLYLILTEILFPVTGINFFHPINEKQSNDAHSNQYNS